MNAPKAVIALSLLSSLAALNGMACVVSGMLEGALILAVISAGIATFIGLARFL